MNLTVKGHIVERLREVNMYGREVEERYICGKCGRVFGDLRDWNFARVCDERMREDGRHGSGSS